MAAWCIDVGHRTFAGVVERSDGASASEESTVAPMAMDGEHVFILPPAKHVDKRMVLQETIQCCFSFVSLVPCSM